MKLLNYKKICVVTGSRADYGLLKSLILKIKKNSNLKLQLVVTGSHLSKEHGYTISEIYEDGFKVNEIIKIVGHESNPINLIKSSSKALNGYAKCFKRLKPDLILILGDRYEIFCAAYTGVVFGIPIAHLHGGEVTQNSYDELFRHAISKLSQIHFSSTETYRKRIIQLGESPKNVHNVGAVGLEDIKNFAFISKKNIENKLKIKFNKKSLLITLHPETLHREKINKNCAIILSTLKKLKNTTLIFTMPNNDVQSNQITKQIKNFCNKNKNAFFFKSLGRKLYLSCIKNVDAVLGNSSSGLIEVPSLNKPSINIGKRQYGRVQSKSIISCDFNKFQILRSIKKVYSNKFSSKLKKLKNPYYKKNSAQNIINVIKSTKLNKILIKKFYDIKF